MDDRETAAQAARDAALRALISNAVALALMVGVSLAVTHRDSLQRAGRRALRHVRPQWQPGGAELAVADLRAAVSAYDHAHDTRPAAGRTATRRGMYEHS
jgi:Pyruvate/2-oxoacid:ferredoxin oxidoreductase gamma subunit